MKNILVTGGCGFIGSNFIYLMVKKYPLYYFFNLDKPIIFFAFSSACRGEIKRPPSEKESGVTFKIPMISVRVPNTTCFGAMIYAIE